jgi:hypothetical protein
MEPLTVLDSAALLDMPIQALTIGHGRDPLSRAAALAFAERWTAAGRTVVDVVDWPEEAASWLRQAKRFTAGGPDAWVVAGSGRGWAAMRRRLQSSADRDSAWDPARTYELSLPAVPLG